ncbi:unnamed protein product [Rangifer tarandus platyrhynchus]|uniref:Uncharacterized protein n=1 Tax=Rangifer tarandus platyrhynchus TaxID=3082113 RepID=A0AC59YV54_RANTA
MRSPAPSSSPELSLIATVARICLVSATRVGGLGIDHRANRFELPAKAFGGAANSPASRIGPWGIPLYPAPSKSGVGSGHYPRSVRSGALVTPTRCIYAHGSRQEAESPTWASLQTPLRPWAEAATAPRLSP